MKQEEIRQAKVSGKPDCRWEGFLRYAPTGMGLALQGMEEALEAAQKEQRRE